MITVYHIGHRNPDTDSIVSPIAYAYLKNAIEEGVNHVPVRLGPPNRETQFVLDYFRVPAPMLLEDVTTEVRDLEFDPPIVVHRGDSMRTAWEEMLRSGVKSLPVVDDQGNLVGIVTLGDIAEAYLASRGGFTNAPVPVANVADALDGEILIQGAASAVFGGVSVDPSGNGEEPALAIVTDCADLALWNSPHTQVIVLVSGYLPERGLMEAAGDSGITVISTDLSAYEAARRVSQSEPVSHIMTRDDLVTFSVDEEVDDVREAMLRHKYRSFPVQDERGHLVGMLGRRHLLDYTGKRVILVDHNEMSQSVEGIEEALILEIIDHHRIGSVETDLPIVFTNRPVGCTATIIYGLYRQADVDIPKDIAGLMCAAILSDTLAFRSPTCTEEDRTAALELADIAGIDPEELAQSMFSAGSSLEGKTDREVFFGDFKEFHVRNLKVGVSQVNMYEMDEESIRDRLSSFMKKLQRERGYDLLVLMLTDIKKEGSLLLVEGPRSDIVERAFGISVRETPLFLPGAISRKKQVIPRIVRAINAL